MVQREQKQRNKDNHDDKFLDIDRMVNEGLGGGHVTCDNGLIEESTTDTMDYPESVIRKRKSEKELDR